MKTVRYEDMRFVWISKYWDGPIEGLCTDGNELAHFREGAEDRTYCVTVLAGLRKAKWLLRKRLFEVCVGKHWSFPERAKGANFYWRRPVWLHKALFWAYYKAQRALKASA